nr:hypothetical protein A8713_033395 [Streptomyces sp. SAT1]
MDEPAHPHGGAAGPVLGEQRVQVPAAVGGELTDGVAALGDQLPQVLGAGDAAGVAAAHADDGDRLLAGRLGLLEPLAGLRQVGGDRLEVIEQLLVVRHR